MARWRNPAGMSTSELYSSLEGMRDAARAVQRAFQREGKRLYSSQYESIKNRNLQAYGQALLPKKLPTTREGMEAYFRTAQQLLNMDSPREQKKEMIRQKANLEKTIGVKFEGPFNGAAQKNLSEFMHSDEWKRVYGFGSGRAMKLLKEASAGLKLSEPSALQSLKQAFADFKATDADLQ